MVVYGRDDVRGDMPEMLTVDEARRIAAGIAKLPAISSAGLSVRRASPVQLRRSAGLVHRAGAGAAVKVTPLRAMPEPG